MSKTERKPLLVVVGAPHWGDAQLEEFRKKEASRLLGLGHELLLLPHGSEVTVVGNSDSSVALAET